MLNEAVLNSVSIGTSLQVHAIRAAPSLVALVGSAVVTGIARVARAVRAAGLGSGRVVAVGRVVLGRASLVSSAASILASVAGTANGQLRLVPRVILTADGAEQLASRRLMKLGLVGNRLGRDVGGKGKSRQGGDGLEKHCGGGVCGYRGRTNRSESKKNRSKSESSRAFS